MTARLFLNREQILKQGGPKTEDVEVPEWGADGEPALVRVRGMSGKERDEYEASMTQLRGNRLIPNTRNGMSKLLVRCLVDEIGKPLFVHGDIEALGELDAAPLQRLWNVAARLSGITDQEIKDLIENFDGTPGDASSSSSPTNGVSPLAGSSTTPTLTS